MAKYIDCEAAVKFFLDIAAAGRTSYNILLLAVARTIAAFPAADVRPVVMCRDCKWTKTDETDDPAIYCMQWDRWETPPDGFCWLGEKREETIS